MRLSLLVAILVLVGGARAAAAQSADRTTSRCSFRSGTTCWTIWGYRVTAERKKPQSLDTLPVFAGTPSRRAAKAILRTAPISSSLTR